MSGDSSQSPPTLGDYVMRGRGAPQEEAEEPSSPVRTNVAAAMLMQSLEDNPHMVTSPLQ